MPNLHPESEYQRRWRKENPEAYSAIHKRCRDKLRRTVMDAYGGKCACCGECAPEFLCIDHVNGGGNRERKKYTGVPFGGTTTLYRSIRDRGFPPDYQVLCYNCNAAKGAYGKCPHQNQS